MELVVVVYDGVSSGEAIAPGEILRHLPGVTTRFVAEMPGPHAGHHPALRLMAEAPIGAVDRADVLLVPGGFGARDLIRHQSLLGEIRRLHDGSRWTLATSSGSLLLAAAGLLQGERATTQWLAIDLLAELGAMPVHQRVVQSGRIVTSMGPIAAVEMALAVLAAEGGDDLAAQVRKELPIDMEAGFDPATSPAAAAVVASWHGAREGSATRRRMPRRRTRAAVPATTAATADAAATEIVLELVEDVPPPRR